jgi:hypothetical protein
MKQPWRNYPLLDWFGTLVSGLCAFHCLALPMMITALSLGGFLIRYGAQLEAAMLGVSLSVACVSLVPGYFQHRNADPVRLWLAGSVFLGGARLVSEGPAHWLCALGLGAGGSLIACAHLLNVRAFRRHAAP